MEEVKIDLKEISVNVMNWTELSRDRDNRAVLVHAALILKVT